MKTIYICKKCKTKLSEEGAGDITIKHDGLCVKCAKPRLDRDTLDKLGEIFNFHKKQYTCDLCGVPMYRKGLCSECSEVLSFN